MRQYLELTENVLEEPEFIRADVTDMTVVERDAVKKAMEDIMAGKDYTLVLHNCYHNETPVKSCESVRLI